MSCATIRRKNCDRKTKRNIRPLYLRSQYTSFITRGKINCGLTDSEMGSFGERSDPTVKNIPDCRCVSVFSNNETV
jgi:hypothetical protein